MNIYPAVQHPRLASDALLPSAVVRLLLALLHLTLDRHAGAMQDELEAALPALVQVIFIFFNFYSFCPVFF